MANYGTPGYDYTAATNRLTQNHNAQQASQEYGRFLGQQRFRRQQGDMARDFTKGIPKVQQHYSDRGLGRSGMKQRSQREFGQDTQRQMQRHQQDWAGQQQGWALQDSQEDAMYNQNLLDLYEQFAARRAIGSPFDQVVI